MKIAVLFTLLIGCALPVLSQYSKPAIKTKGPPRYTVTVYYCACTDGGDFSVDSGEVVVPEQLRQSYVDAHSKMAKLYGTREQIAKRMARNGYQVSSLRAASLAAWDSLFTLPKPSSRTSVSEDEERKIQTAYWRRRCRISGTVVGLKGPYPVFKILRAVRISDKTF